MNRKFLLAIVAFIVLTVAGLEAAGGTATEAKDAWSRVLGRFVDGGGRVDFAGLAHDTDDLDRFVAFVGRAGPETTPELFPNRAEVIAYHINAYNALAMRGILDAGLPDDLDGVFKRMRFFKRRKFTIDGREMSLHAYENDVIRAFGEPRVHFTLNCMSGGCPRLPRERFQGSILESQLDMATREFFNSERHVRVDPDRERVHLSEILKWYKEDFVNDRIASSLVAYVNQYREQPVPESYAVKFIAYDWTVIKQSKE